MSTQTNGGGAAEKRWVCFKLNVAERVVLKSLEYGLSRDFDGNQQHVYTVIDGKRMFVSPIVTGQIERMKIQPGEPVTVRKYRAPNGKSIAWETKRTNEGQPVAAFINGPSLEEYGERLATAPEQTSNLEVALKNAVAAAAAAEKFGAERGYQIRFTPGDIRAMGISELIGMQHGGAR